MMRYIISCIAVIIMTLLVKFIYIANANNFIIAFIGGGVTMLILNLITNRSNQKTMGQSKFKKRDIFILLILVVIIILFSNSYFKSKLANIQENITFQAVTANMEKEKYNNIMYYYTGKKDETYLDKINDYIKGGDNRAIQIFGKTNTYPLNIVMFASSESFGKTFNVNPKNSQAVTILDAIYLPYDNVTPHVFAHEYMHYKMSSFCKEKQIQYYKIPSWFQEGVAEYASAYLEPNLYKNTKLEKIQDFKNLNNSKEMGSYQLKGYDTYFQSYLAINKLVELKGKNVIQEILINTKSIDFYSAFKKVIGLSIDDFQNLLK